MDEQSNEDTLLFGAKVLSTPGFLSNKNVSQIENNNVEGDTTWTHQDAYAKMVIAGLINQSKKIFTKFDEILYEKPPEVLIEGTYKVIRAL